MENVLDWARSVLTTTPIRWEDMAHTLPTELLTRPPARRWRMVRAGVLAAHPGYGKCIHCQA